MGDHMSRKAQEPPSTVNVNPDAQFPTELRSYEAATRIDADLQSFDAALQARAHQVITTLAATFEVRASYFGSVEEITECFLEMNQEVVKAILESKKDIWKNQELFELVEEYFENSLQTFDSCAALEKCLKRARDSQRLILVALQQSEGEETAEGNHHVGTLRELKNFKTAGDPFTEEFFQVFQSVNRQQIQMREKLQQQKHKLDKKLKSIQTWTKMSNYVSVATFASHLICSVVPDAVPAAESVPVGSVRKWTKWINSQGKIYEIALKGEKEVINSMEVGTYISIADMERIRVLIDRLEKEIASLLQCADYAIEKEAVAIGMEEIKKNLGVFTQNIEDLGLQADKCSKDIRRARTVVLHRIFKHPNNLNESFDAALQACAHQVTTTLAAASFEVRAPYFGSVQEISECFLEMNQEVVKAILESKKDIWKNQELSELVDEYFENGLQTFDFCAALEKCLKRARDSQFQILLALQQSEEEETAEGNHHHVRTLRELKNFKTAGYFFTEEFFQVFQSVYGQQIQMLEKLQLQKHKLNKKLKSIHTWTKMSNYVSVATFPSNLICSIEIALKGEKEVINSMEVGTYFSITDMELIRVLIDRLKKEIVWLLQCADYAIEKEAVAIGMEEIKKNLGVFTQNVEDLGLQADKCSKDTRRARTVVLQRIIKHPSNLEEVSFPTKFGLFV